jgi:hypothetical protein
MIYKVKARVIDETIGEFYTSRNTDRQVTNPYSGGRAPIIP